MLLTDLTYPAVRSAAARAAAEAGAGLVEVEILSVLEDRERLVARFAAGLRAGGREPHIDLLLLLIPRGRLCPRDTCLWMWGNVWPQHNRAGGSWSQHT